MSDGDTKKLNRLTAQKDIAIKALVGGLTFAEAAESAGVCRTTIFNWRQNDPDFAAKVHEAHEIGTDKLEDILEKCARKAETDPRYQTSLIFGLKNRRPEKWQDRHDIKHAGAIGTIGLGNLEDMSDDELKRLAGVGGVGPDEVRGGDSGRPEDVSDDDGNPVGTGKA